MEKIIDQVCTFTGLRAGRVYLIQDSDGLTLIDTGLALAAPKIINQLAGAGFQPGDVCRILVTHGHLDHVGGLPELKRLTGAQVVASRIERPFIEGETPIPQPPPDGLSPLGRLMRARQSSPAPAPVDRVVDEGDTFDTALGDLTVLFTPGHTPGHISFWQPEHRILFCGDVLMNWPRLRLPFAPFTSSMAQNRQSIKKLATLQPEVVCFGHGPPLTTRAAEQLAAFAGQM